MMRMRAVLGRACGLSILTPLLLLLPLAGSDCSDSKSTAKPDADTTSPTVSLTVSETLVLDAMQLVLTATASDAGGVAAVEFYDGATLIQTLTASPYVVNLDLVEADNGAHAYRAAAEDAAGNREESAISTVIVAINYHPVLLNGGFDSDPSGWELHNFDPWSGWTADYGNPAGCVCLNEFGSCAVDPGVTQLLTGLIPGLPYTIDGEYRPFADPYGNPLAESFVVTIDSVVVASFARGPNGLGWSPFTATFTATASEHSLGFWAEYDCDDSSYDLDNLVLSVGP